MQSLNDDERKLVLGDVLFDELKAIREYVQDIPGIRSRLSSLETKVDKIDGRLIVIETISRDHEAELKAIKRKLTLA